MDKDFWGIAAIVIFAFPFVGFMMILLFAKWAKKTRSTRKQLQAQINSHKISLGKFTGRNLQEWIRVGEYEIFVHRMTEQSYIHGQRAERVVYAEVEYRNETDVESMSCRVNQWHLFDQNGYSYEAQSGMGNPYLYHEKRYFGSERFIDPGMHARGWFAFTVPQDAKITVLQFMTAFIGTKTANIVVEDAIEAEEPVNALKVLRPDPRSL